MNINLKLSIPFKDTNETLTVVVDTLLEPFYITEREVLSETGDDPVILDLEDSAEDTYMERMKDDEQTSLHEEIFAALYKHNPRWYDAIRYVYYLEIPQSAVAERMEISIEVLHSLLYRARKWIRKKFGVEYEEFLEL